MLCHADPTPAAATVAAVQRLDLDTIAAYGATAGTAATRYAPASSVAATEESTGSARESLTASGVGTFETGGTFEFETGGAFETGGVFETGGAFETLNEREALEAQGSGMSAFDAPPSMMSDVMASAGDMPRATGAHRLYTTCVCCTDACVRSMRRPAWAAQHDE